MTGIPKPPGVRPRASAGAKGSGMGASTDSRKRSPGGPQAPAKPGPENTVGKGALQITNGPELGKTIMDTQNTDFAVHNAAGQANTGMIASPVKPNTKRPWKNDTNSTKAGSGMGHHQNQ
jgi:hypothetical protein